MALTNAMIIFNAQQDLLTEGKIKPTGRMIRVETPEGEKLIPEAEAIHTFARWKELGYQVRRGQHAVAAFSIWKYTSKAKGQTEEDAIENGFCFLKRSFFFSASQVDKIA